jgi:hypothetical protein
MLILGGILIFVGIDLATDKNGLGFVLIFFGAVAMLAH